MQPIHSTAELDERLSRPTPGVLQTLTRVSGDVMVLGAGGKIGPTLARMVRRACDELGQTSRRVMAVSRFSSQAAAASMQQWGIQTIACDLTQYRAVQELPDAPNLLFLAGQKFGTSEAPGRTWIANTLVPALVAERFADSRITALSTGCVYPLVPVSGPGSGEDDVLDPPGEYANSCLGRERIFQYYSAANKTPVILVRLCYAIDLRYGVLLDLAQKVFQQQPVDLNMGWTHVIWQGDASARVVQCLEHVAVPAQVINLTGPERLSVRSLAARLGELLERVPVFAGQEGSTAWVWNAARSCDWFGPPAVSVEEMLQATAAWVLQGGETLHRPTHFEVRDGRF